MSQKAKVVIKPLWKEETISCLEVALTLEGMELKSGEKLMAENRSTVTIPGCPLNELKILDEAGEVPCEIKDEKPYPFELNVYYLKRDLVGTLEITYQVSPYEWTAEDAASHHGPYFEFRPEVGGADTVGHAILPDLDLKGTIQVVYDLSASPEGVSCVSGYGEGDYTVEGPFQLVRQLYYMFGKIQSSQEGEFGFFWLEDPKFDMKAIADFTLNLFRKMQVFFHDDQARYRIFARHDHTQTSGGTAMPRCYMFGWNDHQPVTVEEKQNLLAHEMVHNWPHLNDNPYGITTWYSEGTAEFYSVMLPYRFGLTSAETALKEIQTRSDAFYSNPTRLMSNMDAVKICWQDRRAQRIPYGRGIFYLANIDAQIRRATNGEKSLDDVVLTILEMDRSKVTLGNEAFIETVKKISGLDIAEQHAKMCDGTPFAPDPDSFDALFTVEEKEMPEADTGKTVTGYHWSLR